MAQVLRYLGFLVCRPSAYTSKERVMTIKLLTQCEFEEKWVMVTEIIHCQPTTVMRVGVTCKLCVVDLFYGQLAYSIGDQWVCKACAHYIHERLINSCLLCNNTPKEVNGMDQEIMITPDGVVVISDDVIADIPKMRRVEE